MKTAILEGIGRITIADIPVPRVKGNDVLIRIDTCGLCATDAHMYQGTFPTAFPTTFGHEISGTIEEIGGNIEGFKKGEAVTIDPNIPCGKCHYCRAGEMHLCPLLGNTKDMGFSEYCLAPDKVVYKIPSGLSLEEVSFSEPVSCCIHAIDIAKIKVGDSVVIIGGGSAGLIMAQLAKLSGASKIILTAKRKKRLDLAKKFGADLVINSLEADIVSEIGHHFPEGVDIVIECVGKDETMQQSLKLPKRGGTVIWFGVTDPNMNIPINPFDIYKMELSVKGSFINPHTYSRAIEVLLAKKIDVTPLITHHFPLNQLQKAMKCYREDDSRIKILIKPSVGVKDGDNLLD